MRIHSWWSKACLGTVLASLLACAGCSGYSTGSASNGAQPANTYVYVGQQSRDWVFSISQFQVSSDETFTALNPPSVPIDPYDFSLTIDPSGKYLFTVGAENDLTPGGILQFVIGGDGTLAPNSIASVAAGQGAGPLVFTPNGRYAIAPNSDNTVSSYALSSTGSLSLVNTVLAGYGPTSAVVDSTGKFVYVLAGTFNISPYTISEYSISSSGALNLVVTYPVDVILPNGEPTPTALYISPKGFLYLTEYMSANSGEGSGAIVEFSIDEESGGLSIVNIYSTADSNPFPLVFNSTGTYAYVSNGASFTISQLAVDATTGVLTQNGSDVPGGFLRGAVVDPSGKFLFTTEGQSSGSEPQISLYAINADGTLTPSGTAALLGDNSSAVSIAMAQR